MSLSARPFTVHLADADETISRASRRINIHVDILKIAKIVVGDVLALTDALDSNERRVSTLVSPSVALSPSNSALCRGRSLACGRRID